MKRTVFMCLLAMFAICCFAQQRPKSKKKAKPVQTEKCNECQGKGFVQCPKCEGKCEFPEEYLCDMCIVDEGVEIMSASSTSMRIISNPKLDCGNVKCPYCKNKSRKYNHKVVSKKRYEEMKALNK